MMSTIKQIESGEWFNRDTVSEESVIMNKQILSDDEVDLLIELYNRSDKIESDMDNKIVSYVELPEDIANSIITKLSNYIVINSLQKHIGFKQYKFGGIREHSDENYYNEEIGIYSTYTLLIYLNDCDSGRTAIKRKKYRMIDDSDKKHERIFVTPKKGHCVLFNSKLKHFAEDSYDNKLIAHLRIF